MINKTFGVLLLFTLAVPFIGCSSTSQQYCEVAGECDETIPFFGYPVDGVGNSSDSVDVCVQQQEAYLNTLRANSEEICHDAALAYEAFMLCAIEEGDCDAWTDNDCSSEWEEYEETTEEAGNRCNE